MNDETRSEQVFGDETEDELALVVGGGAAGGIGGEFIR